MIQCLKWCKIQDGRDEESVPPRDCYTRHVQLNPVAYPPGSCYGLVFTDEALGFWGLADVYVPSY